MNLQWQKIATMLTGSLILIIKLLMAFNINIDVNCGRRITPLTLRSMFAV